MTTEADFTEEEWDLVLEGPPAAGQVVSAAERGGTIREAFSIAKEYAETAKEHGGSELFLRDRGGEARGGSDQATPTTRS